MHIFCLDPYPVVTPATAIEVTVMENQPAGMNVEKFNVFAEWFEKTRNANISLQIISGTLLSWLFHDVM